MQFYKSIYLGYRFYLALTMVIFCFILSFFFIQIFVFARLLLYATVIITGIDIFLLFSLKNGVEGKRLIGDRLSNGDENEVRLRVENKYNFRIETKIIDELPFQFQKRDWLLTRKLQPHSLKLISYHLNPVERGEYHFGKLNIFVSSVIGLVQKKYAFPEEKMVAVYPSYIQMQKYELHAISGRIIESGLRKIRKVGHTLEFDHIRDYVRGDDIRVVNWKATARKNRLMINQYQDEKSQNVYNVIDMGRTMKMPFNGMTLLDYAINSSLAISNIAIKKEDKAGLFTYSNRAGIMLPAARRNIQLKKILEILYKQKTDFLESDIERATAQILGKINKRSLLIFYTNFESLTSMQRQINYFRNIAKRHLLIVVFFKNSELYEIVKMETKKVERIYIKTIAEKFIYEKKQMVKELARYGIYSILTEPQDLTVNTINKYLEVKAKGLI